jgi:hypothetical protein
VTLRDRLQALDARVLGPPRQWESPSVPPPHRDRRGSAGAVVLLLAVWIAALVTIAIVRPSGGLTAALIGLGGLLVGNSVVVYLIILNQPQRRARALRVMAERDARRRARAR